MKTIILIATLLSLNGCAFDSLMSNINGSLTKTNKVLSHDLSPSIDRKEKDLNATKSTSITKENDIDCEKDSLKFKNWEAIGKHKIYSKSAREQVAFIDAKNKEMSSIQYKLIRYCNDNNASNSFISGTQEINKDYVYKLKIEAAEKKIKSSTR
jgi:hypothetical protein